MAAALTLAAAAAVTAGALSAVALLTSGAAGTGSVLFGAGLTGGALVFTAVAAVTAQLCETARAATGVAAVAVGAAFLLRAVGDGATGLGALRWFSPLGWVERLQPFVADRAVLLLLPVTAAVALVAVALELRRRRNLGGSLLRTKPGPARAARGLAGPGALAWRRQRVALLWWVAGCLVLGAVFGALADSIDGLAASSPQVADVLRRLGGSGVLVDAYLAGVLGIVALLVAGFAVSTVLRLRADETDRLLEPVLATAVSRRRVLAVQLAWCFGGSAALLLVAGAAAGLAAVSVLPPGTTDVGTALGRAAAQIPAVWVVGAVAALLVGAWPRWSTAAWAVLGGCVLLTEVGPVLGPPHAVLDVSPFTAVPPTAGGVPVVPVVVLTLVAAALTAVAAIAFRRRDIG